MAEEMFKPHLVAWYQADQSCIDGLTLDAYLIELSQLVLKRNWGDLYEKKNKEDVAGEIECLKKRRVADA